MRVVFDTNVFVSALVFPGGDGERALQRVIDGRDQLLVSREIIGELLEVLARKFARDREELARVALFVAGVAEVVEPSSPITVLADEADNRILECALHGGAALIVTCDKQMLALGSHEGVRIMRLREYLESR
jgi:putative PIN family toxin of toxin-antitoxin system